MLRLIVSTLFLLLVGVVLAQEPVSNAGLIVGDTSDHHHDHDHEHYHSHRPQYVFANSQSWVVKYNPLSLTFGGLLYGYQRFLSPQLSTRCSYEVSCSNFGKAAIWKYGLIKGVALAADRLTRCNQLAAYDLSETDLDYENQKIKDDIEAYKVNR